MKNSRKFKKYVVWDVIWTGSILKINYNDIELHIKELQVNYILKFENHKVCIRQLVYEMNKPIHVS